MANSFKQLLSRPIFFPVFLLFICILAFGLLIPQLGFYWDDWPVIFIADHGDLSLFWDYYAFDRPFSAWTYLLTIPVLGVDPQNWQIFTLVLRFITALAMWLALNEIWPQRKFALAAAALLFAVYPSFNQQHISVAYSQHFITYSLFFVSLWAMLRAARQPARAWVWSLLSLFTAVLHLTTMEYFAGLELTRPLLLFFLFREQSLPARQAAARAFKRCLPYFFVLLGFLIYRLYFLSLPEGDPNQARLLADLAAQPLVTVLELIEKSLQDFIFVFFTAWNSTLHPSLIEFSDFSLAVSIGMAALVTSVGAYYLHHLVRDDSQDAERSREEWGAQLATLGAAAVFLGMLPVRISDRDLLTGLFSDRFTLPAMFGAALLWTGLVRLSLRRSLHRALLLAALIGLAVGLHIRTANDYRWDWEKQRRVYWQLHWRAPALQPDTALVGSGALSGLVSEYAAAAAFNTFYNSNIRDGRVDYWALDYYDDLQGRAEEIAAGAELAYGQRNFSFTSSSENLLFYEYSSFGQCVWVLSDQDQSNFELPEDLRRRASLSNPRRILSASTRLPSSAIFGPEPVHDWCFYFEKMDAARHVGDWTTVLSLWDQAQTDGYSPNNQFETLPAIEALARTGQWAPALELSRSALSKQLSLAPTLCSRWADWSAGRALPEFHQLALDDIYQLADCQPPQ